jgi:hypothetical protein
MVAVLALSTTEFTVVVNVYVNVGYGGPATGVPTNEFGLYLIWMT